MEKVEQAVTKNDYQQLMKKILDSLQDKKDQFCKGTYPTLKEARSELYTMMTEIIVQEAGSILDHSIMIKQDERNMVRKLLNKIEYKTSRVEALSASKSKLIQGSTVAKKELLSLAQNEKEIGPTNDPKKDKLRLDTATPILYFLQLDMLPTPRDGIREENTEPFIYKDELQSITQGMRSKLQILNEMATSIVSVEEEESKIRNELGEIILRGEKEH